MKKLVSYEPFYTKEALLSISSDWRLAERQKDVPDLLPTQENIASYADKVRDKVLNEQNKGKKCCSKLEAEGVERDLFSSENDLFKNERSLMSC